jgi:Putative amidoligase enzyme
MTNFIIDIDKTGKAIVGLSSAKTSGNVVIGGVSYALLNMDLLNKLSYNPMRAEWSLEKLSTKDVIAKLQNEEAQGIRRGNGGAGKLPYRNYTTEIYSISDYPRELKKGPTKTFKQHPCDKFIGKYTYGVEIETSHGHFPETFLPAYGVVPLKDGSITGHEYTSVVLNQKNMGVEGLAELFEQMAKYTITNKNCSLHYHVGSLPRTKEFVVALWQLYFRLQDEFDNLMPPYKRNISYLATKAGGPKDHCARLMPLISKTTESKFNEILTFCNDGMFPETIDSKNLRYHHRRDGARKWEYESRYVALNFLPFFFEEKGTVEFRLHSGTVNKYKAISWLFICLALVEYASKHAEKIIASKDKILLEDIIRDVYDDDSREGENLTESLLSYIQERKEESRRIYFADKTGVHDEFQKDNFYVPKTKFNF